jgi:DNA-binding NarL/FixJ family response regulator
MLALLHESFDLVWDDPITTHVDRAEGNPLSQVQLHILRLMASGMTDDAIARSSGISVRTVRRHIASVMEILGSNTRFATGVAATKRGWI